jgi:hypothetical protein
VVAVHEPLAVVERDPDARAVRELARVGPDVGPRGLEGTEGGAGPQQDPHLDAPGDGFGEQLTQQHRRFVALEREVGRRVPAGDAHRAAGTADGLGDRAQRLPAVDEDLHRAAVPWRRRLPAPRRAVVGRLQRLQPSEAPEPEPVMRLEAAFERAAE